MEFSHPVEAPTRAHEATPVEAMAE